MERPTTDCKTGLRRLMMSAEPCLDLVLQYNRPSPPIPCSFIPPLLWLLCCTNEVKSPPPTPSSDVIVSALLR